MTTASFSSIFRFLVSGRVVLKSAATSVSVAGESPRWRFDKTVFLEIDLFCDSLCLENIAWMPSFRLEIGSMKVDDSVPTLPTSLGT